MSRWPKNGDSIFAAGADWEANALMGSPWDWFISYAFSYKDAADAIVESVEAKRVSPDSVSYAVLFLYRHYIEVMLKGLIRLGNMLQKRTADFPNDTHRLHDLWKECRPFLEAAYPQGKRSDTDAVEKCLIELHQIDPSGESFRFGEDKKGKETVPRGLQINLTNLREVMNRVSGFLEGNYDWMDELLQHQAHMDSNSF